MKQITRAIGVDDVRDLVARMRHAHVAYKDGDGISAIPVSFRYADGRYVIGAPPDAGLSAGHQIMLLVDEGWYYFELRGVRLRGRVADATAPPGASATLRWFELLPEKAIAWDYGTMRQRDGDGLR
jgi:hypothetical protein